MNSEFSYSAIIENLVLAFKYVYLAMPVWLPAAFVVACFNAWLRYKRVKTWQKEGSVLLEIKLPREISKSPAAMEVVLNAVHQTGNESTWYDRIWLGKTRYWFSLEIASIEGKIHFYIWTRPKFKNIIESQIYSQYPNVEVYEVEDYTKNFYYNPEKFGMWSGGETLSEKDVYPIKTYIDYGLEKDPKEEYKVDPMVPLIEFLGSIGQGQNIWIQIIIRAHKKRRVMDVFGEKEDAWKDEAKDEIEKIIAKLKTEGSNFPRIMTEGERNKVAALERSITKHPFDCGIRAIYITEKDKFNPANIGGIIGCFKQFNSPGLNGFRPSGWDTYFDYPYQEWFGRKEKLKPKVLEEYKLRRFFYSPWKNSFFYNKQFVLNTEELATIFHFPGEVAATPTLEKIPSVKSKAPSNLPI